MFKIPGNLPIKSSGIEEITDFIEWECIKDEDISLLEKLRPILRLSDEIIIRGIDDDTDKIIALIDEIEIEMNRRIKASGDKYPFTIYKRGYRVKTEAFSQNYWVYTYLLLSTRVNMLTHKVWRGIDGTSILEELAALVAKSYFGDRAESKVFGTALAGTFEKKIEELVTHTGEGHSFLNRNSGTVSAKDDKLDVYVWKDFSDKKRSKLMGFGQCKTGTTWDDAATIELQPDDFCQKWLRDTPISAPIKLFFSSQYFPLDDYSKAKNAGIVFDRFRILEFLPVLEVALFEKLKLWCETAILELRK
jgi:hypothetical protein